MPRKKDYLKEFNIQIPGDYPSPAGYRVLVAPYDGPDKVGSVFLAETTKEVNKYAALVAYVVEVGTGAYKHDKFEGIPWCKEGDWVMIGKNAGMRFVVDGVDFRMLNDDDIVGTVDKPDKIRRFAV